MDNNNPQPNIAPPIPPQMRNNPQNQQPSPVTKVSENGIKPLRTFADDIKEAVNKHDVSISKIIVEEAKIKHEEEIVQHNDTNNPRNITFIVMGIIFILAGVGAYGYFYFLSTAPAPAAIVPQYKSQIIKTESYKEIDTQNINKPQLVETLNKEKKGVLAPKTVKEIAFTKGEAPNKSAITPSDLFDLLDARVPSSLEQTFNSTFLYGFYASNENQPALILKVDSFAIAYSGMLEWEKTMAEDIGPLFFDIKKATTFIPTTASTTSLSNATSSTSTTLTTMADVSSTKSQTLPDFKDVIIKNRDARVLNDVNGNPILLYGFIGKNTIVITTNADTFSEMGDRLDAMKLIR